MALAALGAVVVLDADSSTADAAPSVSRFAGTYVGADPRGYHPMWPVTISGSGQITSSFSGATITVGPLKGKHKEGSISGRIRADGNYSFTVSVTGAFSSEGRRPIWMTLQYKSAGNMVSDAAGNLVGTEDTDRTFSWLRQ
jgi:hypothetical protein